MAVKYSKYFKDITLGFSGTVEQNTCHFEVLVLLLSLKCGTNLCRSRRVHHSEKAQTK